MIAGEVFYVEDPAIANLSVCGWMKGRLLKGDLVMSTGKSSGPHVPEFVILEGPVTMGDGPLKDRRCYRRATEAQPFHAYGIGGPKFEWQPTEREFHLLMAGEYAPLSRLVK